MYKRVNMLFFFVFRRHSYTKLHSVYCPVSTNALTAALAKSRIPGLYSGPTTTILGPKLDEGTVNRTVGRSFCCVLDFVVELPGKVKSKFYHPPTKIFLELCMRSRSVTSRTSEPCHGKN